MLKEEQYYIPDISDLFIGYKCELSLDRGVTFLPTELHLSWSFDGNYGGFDEAISAINGDMENIYQVRTKYLCKEDIESCRWINNGIDKFYTGCINFQFNTVDRDNNYLSYFLKFSEKDRWVIIEEMGSDNLYCGEVKSINEFKKLMNWLNIE